MKGEDQRVGWQNFPLFKFYPEIALAILFFFFFFGGGNDGSGVIYDTYIPRGIDKRNGPSSFSFKDIRSLDRYVPSRCVLSSSVEPLNRPELHELELTNWGAGSVATSL